MVRVTLVAAARPIASSTAVFPDGRAGMAVLRTEDPERVEWRVDPLRAWSAGEWAGRQIDEVAREHPEDFRRWRTDPSFAPAGGESLEALLARIGQWLDALTDERLAVIVDATVVAAAVVHALAATPESFWHLDVPPRSEWRLSRTAGTWRVRPLGIPVASRTNG